MFENNIDFESEILSELSQSQIWSRWAPPNERSMLAGMASAGSWFGNIIALPFGGYLCTNGFDGGLPSIFYIFGTFLKDVFYLYIFIIFYFNNNL
jgi:MFS transporter, ACS family, solute carrier family 17 (sodium-dependent inorganic phosphate cotransporter), other